MRNDDYPNPTKPGQTTGLVECKRLINGRFARAKTRVVIEKELSICINGEHFVTVSLAPVMEREFITGYLFGQGFIASADEIESIKIEGNTARVTVKTIEKIHQRTEKAEYRIVSGGGKSAFFDEMALPQISTEIKVKDEPGF